MYEQQRLDKIAHNQDVLRSLTHLAWPVQPWLQPTVPLPDGGRAGTGGRDFVYADSSKSARVK